MSDPTSKCIHGIETCSNISIKTSEDERNDSEAHIRNDQLISQRLLSSDSIEMSTNSHRTTYHTFQDENGQTSHCSHCTSKETVKKFNKITEGNHICYRSSWCTPYRHHAIVEKVYPENNKLDLISLHRQGDECILCCFCKKLFKIGRTQEEYNNMKGLKVVKYPTELNIDPNKTTGNAIDEMNGTENLTYSLCTYNCEHFCYECTIGSKSSIQVQSCFRKCGICLQCFFSAPSLAFKFITSFIILSIINITHKITHKFNETHFIELMLLCLTCAIPLLICIIMQLYYCKHTERTGNTSCFPDYCSNCSKRHSVMRWIRLVVFLVFQLFWFLYIHEYLLPENIGLPNLDFIQYPLDIVISLAYSFITLFFISIVPSVVRCVRKMKNKNLPQSNSDTEMQASSIVVRDSSEESLELRV